MGAARVTGHAAAAPCSTQRPELSELSHPSDRPIRSTAVTDLAIGLEPGKRFRCTACGNLTRFDVVATERTRRFHHQELGGPATVEEEQLLQRTVEDVVCRWCGNGDAVTVEPAASGGGDD